MKKPDASPLAPFRGRIDQIDREIVALLVERAKLARRIGAVKHKLGMAIYEKSREQQVLDKVEGFRRDPLGADGLKRIYRAIMLTMRRVQVRP